MLQIYADLILLYRIHNRLDSSGRCIAQYTSVGSLSLGERAGVRGLGFSYTALLPQNRL
ncbi:hypothetical protein PDR5_23640 [Pseudomonas sp. DR 5-09]|nr:hypothetical protein PDR5_23640 [Pseudomonas sp. DR 5-09]